MLCFCKSNLKLIHLELSVVSKEDKAQMVGPVHTSVGKASATQFGCKPAISPVWTPFAAVCYSSAEPLDGDTNIYDLIHLVKFSEDGRGHIIQCFKLVGIRIKTCHTTENSFGADSSFSLELHF